MIQVGVYYQAECFQFPFFTLCLPCLLLWFQVMYPTAWCGDCRTCLSCQIFLHKYLTKPWHMVMASTNVVILSIDALCSFPVKLLFIYISHGALPSSHAFCLLIFLFIALEGCCGLCFGNFPK